MTERSPLHARASARLRRADARRAAVRIARPFQRRPARACTIISGGSDDEQRRDGDWLDHDQRYARTDEYLDVLRTVWTDDKPFDHDGAHYRFEQALLGSEAGAAQPPHVPVYFGGASEAAIPVAGKHADVYALWGESQEQVREQITRVRAEAAKHGRSVRFSVSFRPILAETEEAAWERAEHILAETKRLRVGAGLRRRRPAAERRREAPARGSGRIGPRSTSACGPASRRKSADARISTALVGTPEQVADTLARLLRRWA